MPDEATYTLRWDDVVPSMNSAASGYRGNPHAAHRVKKDWEGKFLVMLLQAKVPRGWHRIEASARLEFTDKRRRDAGNYRMLIEKALGDILVAQRYIPDDTPDHFAVPYVTFEKGERRAMELTLLCS